MFYKFGTNYAFEKYSGVRYKKDNKTHIAYILNIYTEDVDFALSRMLEHIMYKYLIHPKDLSIDRESLTVTNKNRIFYLGMKFSKKTKSYTPYSNIVSFLKDRAILYLDLIYEYDDGTVNSFELGNNDIFKVYNNKTINNIEELLYIADINRFNSYTISPVTISDNIKIDYDKLNNDDFLTLLVFLNKANLLDKFLNNRRIKIV